MFSLFPAWLLSYISPTYFRNTIYQNIMKKDKASFVPKENLEITKQKQYQRTIKTIPVEQQTLHHEVKKKPSKKG
jgi:hypothetical protein